MNVTLRPGWTVEQFLEWEERQPVNYEFDGKSIIEMNGSTVRHQIICGNMFAWLHRRLAPDIGTVLLPTQVRTGATVRYPDVAVACSAQDGNNRHVVNPVILFEVTSPSTETTDVTKKSSEYTTIPTLGRYFVVSQDEAVVLAFVRSDNRWEFEVVRSGSLDLPEVGLAMPLPDIYAGVVFPP